MDPPLTTGPDCSFKQQIRKSIVCNKCRYTVKRAGGPTWTSTSWPAMGNRSGIAAATAALHRTRSASWVHTRWCKYCKHLYVSSDDEQRLIHALPRSLPLRFNVVELVRHMAVAHEPQQCPYGYGFEEVLRFKINRRVAHARENESYDDEDEVSLTKTRIRSDPLLDRFEEMERCRYLIQKRELLGVMTTVYSYCLINLNFFNSQSNSFLPYSICILYWGPLP